MKYLQSHIIYQRLIYLVIKLFSVTYSETTKKFLAVLDLHGIHCISLKQQDWCNIEALGFGEKLVSIGYHGTFG